MPFGVRLLAPLPSRSGERTPAEPPLEHVRDLAVTPDLAFVLDGAGLEIRSIDDPDRVRARLAILGGEHVAVEGPLACVACGDRFILVDAGDPDAPSEIATVSCGAERVAVHDGRVFAFAARALAAFDRRGEPIADAALSSGPVVDVAPWRGALICTTADALLVIDVRDPNGPRESSRLELRSEPLDLVVDDGVALVASGRVGVRCFDVRDPARAIDTGVRLVSGDARRVDASGGKAWVLESGRGVRAWDVVRREKRDFAPFRGIGARLRAWGPHLLVASRALTMLPRRD